MINMIWKYEAENVSKIFFLEDDEMIRIIEDYYETLTVNAFQKGTAGDG